MSNKDESTANELRELLKMAAENRPQLRPRPASSDTSSSLSSRSTTKSSKQPSRANPSKPELTKPKLNVSINGGNSIIITKIFLLYVN